jgi:hypothetical protein
MALVKNRQAVLACQSQLMVIFRGKVHPRVFLDRDGQKYQRSVVKEVIPGGGFWPGHEIYARNWMVLMEEYEVSRPRHFYLPLKSLLPEEYIKKVFNRHFKGADDDNDFVCDILPQDRVKDKKPAIAYVGETHYALVATIDWGLAQEVAQDLWLLTGSVEHSKLFPKHSETHLLSLSVLERLEPTLYEGGPDPVYKWEPDWYLDGQYKKALQRTKSNTFEEFQVTYYFDRRFRFGTPTHYRSIIRMTKKL